MFDKFDKFKLIARLLFDINEFCTTGGTQCQEFTTKLQDLYREAMCDQPASIFTEIIFSRAGHE